jgi:hypothetical protein
MLKSFLFIALIATVISNPISNDDQKKINEMKTAKGVYSDYFNSIEWIQRDGVLSLSIDHKYVPLWNIADSFSIIENLFGGSSFWQNRDSLYSQYMCHVQFAPSKNPWNIEPSRTESSWFVTVLNGCNPKLFWDLVLNH